MIKEFSNVVRERRLLCSHTKRSKSWIIDRWGIDKHFEIPEDIEKVEE